MTDYFTIKIPEAEGLAHNERRKEQDLTWLEYIDGQRPDDHETLEAFGEQLARIEDAARTAETRAGEIQRDLEAEGIGR